MKIFAPYVASLLDYAEYQFIDRTVLDKTFVSQGVDLCDPGEMIDAKEYLSIFDQVIDATNSDYCGLNFGCYLNMGALGLVLEISLNTSSIEQGVFILQNFLKNKFPLVSVTSVMDSDDYVLQLESSVNNVRLKRHILDMVISIIYRELKLMLPHHFKPRVELPCENSKTYSDLLKTEVSNNIHHQIVLPKAILKTEINKSKVKEIELLLPKFIAMLNDSKEEEKLFSRQIWHMTLNMCSPELPNFEQVQRQFPHSKRTVQRKLMTEGMSFRKIVNAIKEELSNYLMNEKHLKTKDVAYILGYSESSAYLHAVKSWKRENE